MELLTATTAFALLVTKLVDFGRNAFDPHDAKRKWIWNLLALGLGVAMALLFEIDVLQPYEHNDTAVLAGRFLTGLAIGAAGSGWHEALDALSGVAKATKSSTGKSSARKSSARKSSVRTSSAGNAASPPAPVPAPAPAGVPA
jgi:hypothetical protein